MKPILEDYILNLDTINDCEPNFVEAYDKCLNFQEFMIEKFGLLHEETN